MEGVEISINDGEGFKPLVNYGAWRVAVMNEAPRYTKGNISFLEKHLETDEVFILIAGSCDLLIAGAGKECGEIKRLPMKSGHVYNIKKGTWHSCELRPGASLAVIENSDTSRQNTELFNLPVPV
jgi:hypothetical protein